MSPNQFLTILGITLLLLMITNDVSITKGDPDTTIKKVICNQNLYTSDDPFAQLVTNVLDDLQFVVPDSNNYRDYAEDSFAGATCYGYGRCYNLTLSEEDCCNCLALAAYELGVKCPDAMGGTMMMVDCYLRYEDYDFSR